MKNFLTLLIVLVGFSIQAQDNLQYQTPPDVITKLVYGHAESIGPAKH